MAALDYAPMFGFVALAGLLYWIFQIIQRTKKLPPAPPDSLFRFLKAQKASDGMVTVHLKNSMARWCEDNLSNKYDMSHGCVYRIPAPTPTPIIICCDYKFGRMILCGSESLKIKESEKPTMMSVLNAYRGVSSLLTYMTASKARAKCRKALAPVFSTTNLQKTIYSSLKKQTHHVLERFNKYAANDEVFDMCEVSVETIFEILTVTLFDLPLGETVEGFNCYDFLDARNAYMKEAAVELFVPFRSLMFWSKDRQEGEAGRAKVQKFGELLLDRCIQQQTLQHPEGSSSSSLSGDTSGSSEKTGVSGSGSVTGEGWEDGLPPLGANGKTIISQMLQHEYPSAQHRVADMVTFIIAGYETTANTLSFFLYAMCINPKARHALQALLDELPLSDEGLIDIQHITKLDYFDWCLRESMRLYTVNQFIARVSTEELQYDGMVCPKGSLFYVTTPAIYRAQWMDKPDEFRPERWASDAPQAEKMRDMFMPFSLGLRGCLGQNFAMMELRVFGANFLRFFDFELTEEPLMQCFVTMKPKNLKVKVTPRNTSTSTSKK